MEKIRGEEIKNKNQTMILGGNENGTKAKTRR